MGDEFPELDPETPTEHDLDQAYGSKYLSKTDIGDRKIRTRILKVRKQEMRDDRGGKPTKIRFVVFLEGLDKPMVLNATNKALLVDAFGKPPANWIGASIGVFFDPEVMFAGKRTGGLRLRLVPPPVAASRPAPKPTPTPAADSEWPEEKGAVTGSATVHVLPVIL
jgi:hypothetical protein